MSDGDVLSREEVERVLHQTHQLRGDMMAKRLLAHDAALRAQRERLVGALRDALEHHEAQSRLVRDGWLQPGEDALKADYHAERAEVFRELLEAHREGAGDGE